GRAEPRDVAQRPGGLMAPVAEVAAMDVAREAARAVDRRERAVPPQPEVLGVVLRHDLAVARVAALGRVVAQLAPVDARLRPRAEHLAVPAQPGPVVRRRRPRAVDRLVAGRALVARAALGVAAHAVGLAHGG